MIEKISDLPIRKRKISIIKSKTLTEINNRLNNFISELDDDMTMEEYVFTVNESFALLCLKEYIEDKHCFTYWLRYSPCINEVVYEVSMEVLDIFLQENYSIVSCFLIKAEHCGYDIFPILNDEYFGTKFVNPLEKVRFAMKEGKLM
jgi:hypothetical protein